MKCCGFKTSFSRFRLVAAAAVVAFAATAFAQDTPTVNLSTNNCLVQFLVPAGKKIVQGEPKQLSGWIRFNRAGDMNSLQGSVVINVADLTTHNEDHDQRMRDYCLEAARFPKITFTLERSRITETQAVLLTGPLTIRDVTRLCVIGAKYTVEENRYHLMGGTEMKWTDFSVRDPSTFFTKVKPDLKLHIELWLPVQ
jgi:polyisoprenoid-binding protein YceI